MKLCLILLLNLLLIGFSDCETGKNDFNQPGHLEQFGLHKHPSIKILKTTCMPTAQEFHSNFVLPERPVVFVGAARHSAAYWFWTKEYLKEKYGDLIVRLEAKFEGEGKIPSSEFGYGRDSIGNVLSNPDGNSYIISQVPEPMEQDVSIPPCLGCGFLADSLQEVHLFITGKGGKTLIHRDPYSNIHCLFNGTKDWLLVHKNQTKNIYQSKSSLHEFGGYSNINVDSVDLEKFPKVKEIEFGKVTLNKGDCIYVPAEYWHQVRVNGEYNTAVSIWFTRNFKFLNHDWSDCSNYEPVDYKPMNKVDILWRFSGKNEDLTQGHMDVHLLRVLLINYSNDANKINLNKFCNDFFHNKLLKNKFISSLKADADGFVDKEYIQHLSKHELKKSLVIIDPSDPSNTREFEYSQINKDVVLEMLKRIAAQNSDAVEKSIFLKEYRSIGGTKTIGEEIFKSFAGDETSTKFRLLENEFDEKVDVVLQKFVDASSHDPTLERKWHKHLQRHDEL